MANEHCQELEHEKKNWKLPLDICFEEKRGKEIATPANQQLRSLNDKCQKIAKKWRTVTISLFYTSRIDLFQTTYLYICKSISFVALNILTHSLK